MRRLSWFLVIMLIPMSPVGALAQDAESEPEAEYSESAQIHFAAGREHFNAGRYEQALTEFDLAYEQSHEPELLYNVGLAHERLGHYAEAADALEGFIEGADNPDPALRERVSNLRARAEQQAAEAREDAQVAPDSRVSETDDEGNGLMLGAVISYVVAGAGLVTLGVFGALALSEDSNLAGSCGADAGMTCSDDDVSTANTFALVADIGLGVAIAGAAVGTVLLVLGMSGDDEEEQSARMTVAPAVGPSAVGVAAWGNF